MYGPKPHLPLRWIALAVLPAFLGLWLQPQVNALYHAHRGGDYTHIHARLLTSPAPSREHSHSYHHRHAHTHHHPHPHHAHSYGADPHQTHSHGSVAPPQTRPAQLHGIHFPSTGHWHTTVSLHWASYVSPPFIFLNLPLHPFQEARVTPAAYAPSITIRSRAPPFSA